MLKDITIQHGDFGTVQPEIIHISVKGKSLGTGSFGMLLRHIEKEKGTDSGMAAFSFAMLADKPAVIYVDDVMAAADDTFAESRRTYQLRCGYRQERIAQMDSHYYEEY